MVVHLHVHFAIILLEFLQQIYRFNVQIIIFAKHESLTIYYDIM